MHTIGSGTRLRPLALAVMLTLGATATQAATITVTTGGDAGTTSTCTLRQAIVAANTDAATGSSCVAGSGADIITFDTTLAGATITLAAGELPVNADLTLTGIDQTLDAAGASRVLNVDAVTFAASDLTLTGGSEPGGEGGALYIASGASVALSRVTVSGSTAAMGGGIYCSRGSSVAIDSSSIVGNTAAEITGGLPAYGGGLYAAYADVTISNSTISGNQAVSGGGFNGRNNDQLILTNVTVTGNEATDMGGGLFVHTDYESRFNVFDSTISGNQATNSGGGVVLFNGSEVPNPTLTADNDIIAGNTAGTASDADMYGSTFPIAQSNLFGTALAGFYPGNGNVFNDAPGLGALASNGGPTWTMALQPGSPALDAGNNALVPAGLTTDQRGSGFARIANGTVDIGAFELAAATAPPVASVPVPVRSPWALGLLAALLGFFGLRQYRRRAKA